MLALAVALVVVPAPVSASEFKHAIQSANPGDQTDVDCIYI